MKILLTHKYFWPDSAPYGLILKRVGQELAAAGHDVSVFTSAPSYGRHDGSRSARRETVDGIAVVRCFAMSNERSHLIKRLANILIYCTAVFAHVVRMRPDVVTAGTFPPVIAAWSASLAARLVGARFIYHMQDIHPEVSYYSGGRLGRGAARWLLRWLDNHTLRRSHAIVTLSADMRDTLLNRGLGPLPIHVINNPSLDAGGAAEMPPPELRKPAGVRRVIFAGNLGRFQNLPKLAEGIATRFEAHPDLELMFLGEGVMLGPLKARWGEHPQVRFGPFLPFAQARVLMQEADIGIASLAPDIYRVAYPSKIATYLDLGLRVLALVEPESNMARELEASGQGGAPLSDDPEAIGAALDKLLAMRDAPPSSATRSEEIFRAWVGLLQGCGK